MSGETLREAAALMREQWGWTADGPHMPNPESPVVQTGRFNLAVADWLDDQACYWDTVDADPSYGYMEGDPALAVARAYLRVRP